MAGSRMRFKRVLCRNATDQDLGILRHAYDTQAAIYQADVDSARALLSVGAAGRDESLNITEHAALSAVCLAILNLDEALTQRVRRPAQARPWLQEWDTSADE